MTTAFDDVEFEPVKPRAIDAVGFDDTDFDDDDLEIETETQVPPPPPPPPTAPDTITTPEDARSRSTAVPPELVEAVQTEPELLRKVARSMGAISLHNLFEKSQHPNTSLKDRLDVQSLLNKMGGLESKETTSIPSGQGFSITINLPPTPTTKGHTIEAKAEPELLEISTTGVTP